MTKILKVEKRGCDFWGDSFEAKNSDMENFRYFCYISKNKKKMLEICPHSWKKSKYSKFYIMKTHISMSFYDKKGYCWGDSKNSGFCFSGRWADVLQYINAHWGTHFEKVKICDKLD